MILPMILNGHHKEFVIKAFAQFMIRTRETEIPLIKDLGEFFRPTMINEM